MRKKLTKIFWNIEGWAVQKHVNLVDLVKSFPTNIFLQNLASIQKRTSPTKFDHLAEKSDEGSISNLSTKAEAAGWRRGSDASGPPAPAALTVLEPSGNYCCGRHLMKAGVNIGPDIFHYIPTPSINCLQRNLQKKEKFITEENMFALDVCFGENRL